MADIAPMLGAILGISRTPKGEDKKRAVKPKTKKGRGDHKVTGGERSVTSPAQQHGELASYKAPPAPTDRKLMRESAKHTIRSSTDSWVSGHITTKEHGAVVARAKHVLSGKHPHEFKGPSGERSFKKLR